MCDRASTTAAAALAAAALMAARARSSGTSSAVGDYTAHKTRRGPGIGLWETRRHGDGHVRA